jgi:hypothetical protein
LNDISQIDHEKQLRFSGYLAHDKVLYFSIQTIEAFKAPTEPKELKK